MIDVVIVGNGDCGTTYISPEDCRALIESTASGATVGTTGIGSMGEVMGILRQMEVDTRRYRRPLQMDWPDFDFIFRGRDWFAWCDGYREYRPARRPIPSRFLAPVIRRMMPHKHLGRRLRKR